jgi:hypothetical protein
LLFAVLVMVSWREADLPFASVVDELDVPVPEVLFHVELLVWSPVCPFWLVQVVAFCREPGLRVVLELIVPELPLLSWYVPVRVRVCAAEAVGAVADITTASAVARSTVMLDDFIWVPLYAGTISQ